MKTKCLLFALAVGVGTILALVGVLAALGPQAQGLRAAGGLYDLADGEEDVRIRGQNAYDRMGASLTSADINGDGYDDLILGAVGVDTDSISDTGAAYIIINS